MDSSPAHSATPARRQVEQALDALGLDVDEVPEPLVDRMTDRARLPGVRLTIGRYLVVGELGRGGMGVVYEGWDPGIERRVAIKTVEPELVPEEDRAEVVERFRRETKVVGRLKHRAIVTVFDSGRQREPDPVTGRQYIALYYYVMEFLEGVSLARRLREQDRLSEAEALRITIDIAEALQLSHDAGIIHRDIKPSNIFLRGGTEAVLLDFGIAKTGQAALTRQGQILGTPSYLAPERLHEKDVAIDGRADIFSLGVLLFTMVTGEAPFVGNDVYDVIDKIARASHPKLKRDTVEGVAMADVIDRMLAKRPADRFPTAAHAAIALNQVLQTYEQDNLLDTDYDELEEADFEQLDELEKTNPSTPTPIPMDDEGPFESDFAAAALDREIAEIAALAGGDEDAPPTELLPSGDDILDVTLDADENVMRASEAQGTRPDVALMRQTREIHSGVLPKVESVPSFLDPETTSPSVPPGMLLAVTAGVVPEGSLGPGPDASDDETVADPSFRVPSNIRNQPIVRAHQNQIATEQVIRTAKSERHTEAAARAVRGGSGQGRNRIEASLIDEGDVVVHPAPLDAMNPDELPTHTGLVKGAADSRPEIIDQHESETRGDVVLPDPAESQPPIPLNDGSAGLRGREFEMNEPSGTQPQLEVAKSAAVARRTIGPKEPRPRAKSGRVQVSGDPLAQDFTRSRLIRRRIFMLVVATVFSVGIGLLLGRLNRGGSATPPPRQGLVAPEQTALTAPTAESRRNRVRAVPGTGQPALVQPRPASELIKDAEAARLSGHLDDAARLFESAIRASADGSRLRPKALLGRADVLRQLGQQANAVRLYRMVSKGHPKSPQAEQAKVALQELGQPLRRRRRTARSASTETPAAAPRAVGTPTQQCRAVVTKHLSNPRGAIRALEALRGTLPDESCVSWYLANKYEQLEQAGPAVAEYKRYLKLSPNSARRSAVKRRIRDLQAKLRQR